MNVANVATTVATTTVVTAAAEPAASGSSRRLGCPQTAACPHVNADASAKSEGCSGNGTSKGVKQLAKASRFP